MVALRSPFTRNRSPPADENVSNVVGAPFETILAGCDARNHMRLRRPVIADSIVARVGAVVCSLAVEDDTAALLRGLVT